MFEAMALAIKMSEVLKTVDKNIQYLADQIDASTFCARSPHPRYQGGEELHLIHLT